MSTKMRDASTSSSCCFLFSLWVITLVADGSSGELRRELGLQLHGGGYDNYSLAHVNATGPDDVLHHFWGASRGGISLLIALTSRDTDVKVDWRNDSSRESKITFSKEPGYAFGIVFPQVVEYRDLKDKADVTAVPSEDVSFYDMRRIQWRGTVRNDKADSVVLRFSAVKLYNYETDGKGNASKPVPFRDDSFVFQVSISGSTGRGHELPHLGHSMNCSEIEVQLNGLEFPTMSNYSRFALPVTVVSSDDLLWDPVDKDNQTGVHLERYSSMDDEYSPGIFQMVHLGTSSVQNSKPGGFMVWRPVAYLTGERDFNTATNVVTYDLKDISDSEYQGLNETLLYAYFGQTWNLYHVQSTNISFGLPEDGWFFNTNFTVWNVVVGYGTPPEDPFSPLILTAIIACVVVPGGFTLVGAVFVITKKIAAKASGASERRQIVTPVNS